MNDLRTVVEVSDVHPAVITIVIEGVLGKLGKMMVQPSRCLASHPGGAPGNNASRKRASFFPPPRTPFRYLEYSVPRKRAVFLPRPPTSTWALKVTVLFVSFVYIKVSI